MSKKIGAKYIIISLLLMPVFFGCLPETKKEVLGPKREALTGPLFTSDIIEKKTAYIKGILETKDLDDEDREMALNLLSAYKRIGSVSQDQVMDNHYREIIHILFSNLSRLDEKYFSKKKPDDQLYSKVINLYSLKRKKILDTYLSGDYQGVINDCVELEAAFGPDSLTPEIGLLFAVSLAKKDMLSEALNIGEKIIRELEGRPDLIHLRANIIEWQLDMGNREKALQLYEKLMDNLDERESIFNRVRQRVTGEEERIVQRKRILPKDYSSNEAELQEPNLMEKILMEVDRLVQKHAFAEAKLLLIKQRLRSEEGPEIETIDQALKTVELAEEIYQEGENFTLSRGKETLELATKLIEKEKFEEAIAKLEELENNQDFASESKEIKDLAMEKLINRERNRAAKIFLMAKKTSDPVKKEELLISSYNILKTLIEKYPSSSLIKRLNSHLISVGSELDKLRKDQGY